MKALVKSVARKAAYITAVVIIIAAILVCFSRMLTPVLDQHRGDFEKWASELLQKPVLIKSVRVSWDQYQPEISLNQVTVLDSQSRKPILQVDQVSVFFSIPESLWQRKPVPAGIMISGTDVVLHQDSAGEYSVQGFPAIGGFNSQPFSSESRFADIMGWLSIQPRLILNDIDVRYIGLNGNKRFLTLYNLTLKNSNSAHVILGKAELHQEIPTQINFSLEWEGSGFDLSQINAKGYLYVSGLSLGQWMKGYAWHGWQVNEGIVSAKIWAGWNHGSLQRIQSNYQAYDLSLYSAADKSTHTINRISGNIGWKREGASQVFAGDDILIDLPAHLWPVSSFYVLLAPDDSGSLVPKSADIGYVDLKDVQSFIFSCPPEWLSIMPDSWRQLIQGLHLQGSLQNAAITFASPWNDWQRMSLNASFNRIKFSQWKKIPGVSNLAGEIKWNATEGSLFLKSNKTRMDDTALFPDGIELDQLTGTLQAQRGQNDAWVLRVPSLQILNTDLAANVGGNLTIPQTGSPVLDFTANFTMPRADHISRYMPMGFFDPDLAGWLKQAFLSGEVKSGHAVLRGALADFPFDKGPFDKGNGVFSVSSVVSNLGLRYAPDWPALEHLNAKLDFTGRKMTVDVDNAEIMNISISGVQAVIPYLGDAQPQILQVQSEDIKTDFTHALAFVHASPLEKNIGKMFNGVDMTGVMSLRLALTVPLKNPDNTKVLGNIDINDAEMDMAPWQMDISHLYGQIKFTESSTEADNVQGQLFNKPLQFNLATVQKAKDLSVVRALFATSIDTRDLDNWLKIPFTNYAQGTSDVSGSMDFSLQQPMQIHLQSNLSGMALTLPDKMGKTADETRDFAADITAAEKQPLKMKISYGKLFGAALVLDRKDEKYNLIAANLRLGGGEVAWPAGSGLYVTGSLDKLSWAQIKEYSQGANGNSIAPLRSIDIKVNSLDLMGEELNNVQLQVMPEQKNWQILINSPAVAGQITLPQVFSRRGQINAQFQKMNLSGMSKSNVGTAPIDVKQLPSISIQANNFSYNNMPFGQIAIKTIPANTGLNIQSLHIISPLMELQAKGDWVQSRGYTTHLSGKAVSSKVTELLASLGIDAHNFVSSNGALTFDLDWQDAPFAPALSSMSGNVSMNMGAGRIVDIGRSANAKVGLGQLLSIFSLQTIPRRLTFDFSDVFQKGYSFDSIKGDFELHNGNAYTSDFLFDGTVAKVGINGRIGLKDKDFNFTLIVIPSVTSVTSSIPLAATLITMNPLVGIGAFAVNTVLGSQFSKVTTYYYDVTGPWNNPVWKSVKVYKAK